MDYHSMIQVGLENQTTLKVRETLTRIEQHPEKKETIPIFTYCKVEILHMHFKELLHLMVRKQT